MDEIQISVKDIPRIKKNTDGQTVLDKKDVKKMKTLFNLGTDGKTVPFRHVKIHFEDDDFTLDQQAIAYTYTDIPYAQILKKMETLLHMFEETLGDEELSYGELCYYVLRDLNLPEVPLSDIIEEIVV